MSQFRFLSLHCRHLAPSGVEYDSSAAGFAFFHNNEAYNTCRGVSARGWGDGYENVTIACTVENQRQCDIRMPVFLSLPVRHRCIICEPLLESIDPASYACRGAGDSRR